MMNQAAHTRTWETAETIIASVLLIAPLLEYFLPLPLLRGLPMKMSLGAGLVLFFIGLAIVVRTRRQFYAARQPTDPRFPTTQLLTEGIFSWSRNPLYLANLIFFLGLGIMLNSLWFVILLFLIAAGMHYMLIIPEERYLEAKFGEQYQQYKRSVRRWVGRR